MAINDERVQFYLKHRDQLEEWEALRPEAAAAIDEWLNGLKPDVDSLASELGDDVEPVVALEDTPYPSLFLKRVTWQGTTKDDSAALIGLEWVRGKTLLGADSAPYVGVNSERTTFVGGALRQDEEFQRTRRERKDRNTAWWAALRYQPPQAPFPECADEYRRVLLRSIREAWDAYAPAIDRVVTTTLRLEAGRPEP